MQCTMDVLIAVVVVVAVVDSLDLIVEPVVYKKVFFVVAFVVY